MTSALSEALPDLTGGPNKLVTFTTANQLAQMMAHPEQVTGQAPTPSVTPPPELATPGGVANPYGRGISAYEPNTQPLVDLMSGGGGSVGKLAGGTQIKDLASGKGNLASSDDPAADQKNASDAAQKATQLASFASGGVVDASGKVQQLVQAALTAAANHVPYVWGGTSLTSGADCSGLIYAAAQAAGIQWPRLVAHDYGKLPQVDQAHARPGDIVYYEEDASDPSSGHVGIYLGGGMMVAAPQTGDVVKVQQVYGAPTYHRAFTDTGFNTVLTPDGGSSYGYNGRSYNPYAGLSAQQYMRARAGMLSPQARFAAVESGDLPDPKPDVISDQARFAAAEHGDTLTPPTAPTATPSDQARFAAAEHGDPSPSMSFADVLDSLSARSAVAATAVPVSHDVPTGAVGGGAVKADTPYASLFNSAAARYGVPAGLLAAMARQESGFNPNARSGAGAMGLMQFMLGTAAGLGVNPWDPASSIDGAARYLAGLYAEFRDWNKAVAAYNAGPGNVREYGGVPPFRETQNYVRAVLAGADQYRS